MAGQPTYIYETGQSEWPPKAIEHIHSEDLDVEVVEASEWDDTERMEFYQSKLFPRSVRRGKKLRGRVRTHKAGNINFYSGVLLTGGVEDGDFFIGEEAVDRLRSMEGETDE
jgi:hypothetical protein